MALTPIRYAMGPAIAVATTVCVSGCVSILSSPSLDEQADALHRAQLTRTSRYAVAARDSNMHTKPVHPIGDRVAATIADVVAEKLGIEAVPLSHATGSDWSRELSRAHRATGWITSTDNTEFFRNAGFDGYVLVTLYEEIEYYDQPKELGSDRKFLTYDPVFHMFALPGDKEEIMLMQGGTRARFTCEMEGEWIRNEAVCVDAFVKRFRRALDLRIERNEMH